MIRRVPWGATHGALASAGRALARSTAAATVVGTWNALSVQARMQMQIQITKQVAEKGKDVASWTITRALFGINMADDDADADVDPARLYIYPAITSTADKTNKQRYKIFYLPMMIDR